MTAEEGTIGWGGGCRRVFKCSPAPAPVLGAQIAARVEFCLNFTYWGEDWILRRRQTWAPRLLSFLHLDIEPAHPGFEGLHPWRSHLKAGLAHSGHVLEAVSSLVLSPSLFFPPPFLLFLCGQPAPRLAFSWQSGCQAQHGPALPSWSAPSHRGTRTPNVISLHQALL